MKNPKIIFGVVMLGLFLMKQWWLFLPMFGFSLGYLMRGEIDRQASKKP